MHFQPLAIADVVLIAPRLFRDARGFFFEAFESKKYAEAGIRAALVQDNHSGSHAGVLRGLHYQLKNPQGKLVSVVAGEVFDVDHRDELALGILQLVDRKSTRLNSSHQIISYAVFCLKKKKKSIHT